MRPDDFEEAANRKLQHPGRRPGDQASHITVKTVATAVPVECSTVVRYVVWSRVSACVS